MKLRSLVLATVTVHAASVLAMACGSDDDANVATEDAGSDAPSGKDGTTETPDTGTADTGTPDADASTKPLRFLGIDSANRLVKFSKGALGSIETVTLSGLEANEKIVGIDVRPLDKALYGIGSTSRLYKIDMTTGAALQMGVQFATVLSGTSFGVDFNPVVDRLRVVSNTGQNFRLNPDTGIQIPPSFDTNLTFAVGDPNAGVVSGNAIGHTMAGIAADAGTTVAYVVDATRDVLTTFQGSPNGGMLSTTGPLAVDVSDSVGLDIVYENGADTAYLVSTPSGASASTLYHVNLATGAATAIGQVGGSPLVALTHER